MAKARNRTRRGRGTTLVRTLTLLRMLQTQRMGVSVRAAAEELETSTRTIYRDLAALQEAGFILTTASDGTAVLWRLQRERGKGR